MRNATQAAEVFGGISTACPCGRQHVTVFKLRHIKDNFFRRLGEFYAFAEHDSPQTNKHCDNSGKSPDWGGPAKPPLG